jgi:gliding motility-associated protein GldM
MGHGNLSPRQKMINIMYLILTALLAMNVSAEVLQAFVLVNESLVKTEQGISKKNYDVYAKFNSMNAANPGRVGPWLLKANDVQKTSKDLVDYITGLQKDILVGAGEDYESYLKNGTKIIEKKDDREGPLNVMMEERVEGGKTRSVVLKDKLVKYRAEISRVLTGVPNTENIMASMNDNLGTEDRPDQEGKMKSWERINFEQLPLVAVLTMLSKLKTDVLNTESDAINSLIANVDAKTHKFTGLDAIVVSEKGYVLSGEPYNAKIFVAAFDTSQTPIIILDDGTEIKEFDENNKGIYSTTRGPGAHKLKGKIRIKKPGSETEFEEFPFETEFQVAVPSVSVSPDKMNVFYIGVDNPVTITAAGTPADQINASIGGGGTIKKVGGSSFIVRVKTAGKTSVSVTANGRTLGSKEFRVKSLPNPVTTLGAAGASYYKGGPIPKSTLMALSGPNATMENFDFELSFNIVSFNVTCNIGGFDEMVPAKGRNFTPQQKSIIQQVKKNGRVIIEDVRASGPDGTVRKISDLVLKVQ